MFQRESFVRKLGNNILDETEESYGSAEAPHLRVILSDFLEEVFGRMSLKREVQIPIEGDGYDILTHDSLEDGGYTLISAQAVQPQTVLQFYSLLPDEYFEDSQRISCVHD